MLGAIPQLGYREHRVRCFGDIFAHEVKHATARAHRLPRRRAVRGDVREIIAVKHIVCARRRHLHQTTIGRQGSRGDALAFLVDLHEHGEDEGREDHGSIVAVNPPRILKRRLKLKHRAVPSRKCHVKWRTIAILVAAEVAILGLAVFSVRGAPSGEVFAADGTGANFAAKTFAPIAAGNAPRVTIDDPNSGVTIGVSDDSLVYVKDDTSFSGATLRSPHDYPQLAVTRDLNGVHISRPAYHEGWAMFIGFSNSRQHFEVLVPAAATVVVDECDNAEVSDLKNGATIKALDGRIELTHVEGAIVAHTDDGHITADGVTSPSLDLSSNDGRIEIRNFTAVAGGKYNVATRDGRIDVGFTRGSDVTVDASTNDGTVRVDGVRQHSDDNVQQSIRIGSGGSAMRIHSDDGSITISTNGAN